MDIIDLLVIGAGPTGLTAAAEATRLGLSVRIVDRKASRSTFSKALVMHARTLEALGPLGIADTLVAEGAQFEALNVRFGDREPVRVDLGALDWGDTRFPYWLSIPQYATERVLEERLEALGGTVEWETSLVDLKQDEGAAHALLTGSDGTEAWCSARYVVGADGGRSKTRELVGIGMDRQSLGQSFILADAKTTCDLIPTEGHGWRADGGLLLIVPMPEAHMFRIIAHMPKVGPDDQVSLDATFLDEVVRERTGIAFGAHDLAWTSQFALSQGLSESYRSARVFLAGDAAHVHSPVGGQGMNTGIQDALNLVWKLALARAVSGEAAETYLASYEEERRPVAGAMVQATGRATKLLCARNPLLRFVIAMVGSRLVTRDRVQQILGRPMGMLDVAYAASAILPRSSAGSPLTAGQRLPDVPLGHGRLHDLLAPIGHTLLDLDAGTVSSDGEPAQLGPDDASCLRDALGQGLVLVRPDRIVGGTWNTMAALRAFPPADAAVQRGSNPGIYRSQVTS